MSIKAVTELVKESLKTDDLPKNATIRQEYVKCGNPDCTKEHGPYLYAYWKENKKLKKKYVGKSWDDYYDRKGTKALMEATGGEHTIREWKKYEFIHKEADKGNKLAQTYNKKINETLPTVGINWAYKQLKQDIRDRRCFKMVCIAKKHNWVYESPRELIHVIVSDMESKGLDATNMDVFDSYLKSNV